MTLTELRAAYVAGMLAELTAIAREYEKTAPTVSAWADDLYIRAGEKPDAVPLSELLLVERMRENGAWFAPNYAANAVYHLAHRLGRDTTGQAGF